MANKLDPMDLKQILTLHREGFSNRKIATTLGFSRNTVNNYVKLFNASNYSVEQLLAMDNGQLEVLFPASTTIVSSRFTELMSYLSSISNLRHLTGFTFQYHYLEYKAASNNPYSYTQFMEHCKRKFKKESGSMKLEHKAGNELFIDFAGKKLQIVDPATGEVQKLEVFVAILPSSQYTYVQACMSQKREDLFNCIAGALVFFGGVPRAIVCDNLKSAVTRASKYEAVINRSFKDFARHYECVINPARAYSPQDKALVENAVSLAYQRIYYPMREMTFFNLSDINKEIKTHLEDYNNRLFSRRETSRKELFYSIEKQLLNPLPQNNFELKGYTRAKVQKTGYVYFSVDKTYYSVPFRYIGKYTQIQHTNSKVEVFYNHTRIASHKRNESKGLYHTIKEHLCSHHQKYLEWSPDFFKNKAVVHGQYVLELMNFLFSDDHYPEIKYKRAMGILQLHKQYGSKRLNTACKIALSASITSYHRIKNILQNGMDKLQDAEQELNDKQVNIPLHSNIRGAEFYS